MPQWHVSVQNNTFLISKIASRHFVQLNRSIIRRSINRRMSLLTYSAFILHRLPVLVISNLHITDRHDLEKKITKEKKKRKKKDSYQESPCSLVPRPNTIKTEAVIAKRGARNRSNMPSFETLESLRDRKATDKTKKLQKDSRQVPFPVCLIEGEIKKQKQNIW